MENKTRVIVNIYYKTNSNNTDLFQFDRIVSLNDYYKILAFIKGCPLVKTAFLKYCPLTKTYSTRPLATNGIISVTCSNEEDKLAILQGLENCIENSFLDEITRTDTYKVYINIFYADSPADDSRILKYSNDALTENTYHELLSFLENSPNILNIINPIEDGKTKYICFMCSNRNEAQNVLLKIENLCENPEDETDSIESDIYYITHNLDTDDLFLQMAEEAAELSQACLKFVRAHKGNNPTKDSEDVYLKGIIEEFTDVQVCADAIDITTDSDIYESKIHRWADRICKKNRGDEEK